MPEPNPDTSSGAWIKNKVKKIAERTTDTISDGVRMSADPTTTFGEAAERSDKILQDLPPLAKDFSDQARREIAERAGSPLPLDLEVQDAFRRARRIWNTVARLRAKRWYKPLEYAAFIIAGATGWIAYNTAAVHRAVGPLVQRVEMDTEISRLQRRIDDLSKLAEPGFHSAPPMVHIPESIAALSVHVAIPERQVDHVRPIAQVIGGFSSFEDQIRAVDYLEAEQRRRSANPPSHRLDLPTFTSTGVNWGGGGIAWRK